ncbi:serine/threonine-protein kinase [Streptosporangium sp. CA-115845]|uniref:serine/threonine-protein kinase n=1 Tax=Streptosporangium sp. CA-115845 TaxID=3240071 RepID=UPI003D922239
MDRGRAQQAGVSGRVLTGRYRLVEILGQGGMGAVWRARDELLHRDVAVKEVRSPRGMSAAREAELRERTLREARAAARLRHPAIVAVHDVLDEGGLPWIVMDLVAGRTLEGTVRAEGPLPPERVAAIGVRVLDALTEAHRRGIMHRDVKPANIMLGPDGQALLTDFGIAVFARDAGLTAPGNLVGSPGFIAPERLGGEADDPRADLWSLGATLYTAAQGKPPFHRETPIAVLGAVLTQPPPAPSFPGPLGPLLLALLAKDPADRPDVAELRRTLGRIADGLPVDPSVPGPRTPATGSSAGRRRGVLFALGALVLAGAVTVPVAVGMPQGGRTETPAPSATAPAVAPNPCLLLTLEQVRPLVMVERQPTPLGGTCGWADDSDYFEVNVELVASRQGKTGPEVAGELYAVRKLQDIAQARSRGFGETEERKASVKDIADLGDDAFSIEHFSPESATSTIAFRTGNLLVKVEYIGQVTKNRTLAAARAKGKGVAAMADLVAEGLGQ